MQIDNIRPCGLARAGFLAVLAGLVAGCAEQSLPAPVFQKSAYEPVVAPAPPVLQVVVRHGQTLDGFAYTYRVPKSAIIAANGLRAPYELKAGSRLIIPNARGLVRQAVIATPPSVTPAAAPQPGRPPVPPQQAAIPQPPPSPQAIALPSAGRPPQTIFAAPEGTNASQPPSPPPTVAAPPSAARVLPDIIPLDGPPPSEAAAPPRPAQAPATLSPPQASPTQQAAPATVAAAAPAGRFPWPVRGRILASYGSAAGGARNDGINIAAPLGTPVRSIDSGTVAYAGNEVKEYGNIVLIKHANGWISAYAHLDDVAVKPGDSIAAGQVIAKVGSSGSVTQPQLHFELRRGKKPVNPAEFLAPAPSAETSPGNRAG